jgi:glycosyltransferase involved in cell wall biosynthesis
MPDDALRVVFFGSFTPLQGVNVIARTASLLAQRRTARPVCITLVGTGQDHALARQVAGEAAETIAWIDWVPPQDLPTLVADHDVCLGIFGTSPKARRVVPTKVFPGAAAGCAIVTADTPAQRRALSDAAVYVPPGDAEALAEALASLAASPRRVALLQSAAARRADRRFSGVPVTSDLCDATRREAPLRQGRRAVRTPRPRSRGQGARATS